MGSYRSYDDCKNAWKNVIYPVLSQTSWKDKRADFKILKYIIDNDIEDDWEINFADIDNGRTEDLNESRWIILQKYLGSRNIRKTNTKAEKLIEILKSKKREKPKGLSKNEVKEEFNIYQFYEENYN